MADSLQQASRLAKREKTTRKGRRGYSDELKTLIKAAAEEHSKAEIERKTGITFPTLQRIIGKTRKPRKTKAGRPAAKPKNGRRARGSAVVVEIKVKLPSGALLNYSDLSSLRADASALAEAAKAIA